MKLRWSRRALADLQRLSDRIAAGDKPQAAQAFIDTIAGKVAQLQSQPLLGRIGAYQDTRELIVHRNYLITYRARADEVQLLQLWHVARERKA